MFQRHERLRKLKKALERIAFISLLVDICISFVTVTSFVIGQSNAVGIIFILNYILTAIVVISLVLMGLIVALTHYHGVPAVIRLFKFWRWKTER